jgi:hypothetical protein
MFASLNRSYVKWSQLILSTLKVIFMLLWKPKYTQINYVYISLKYWYDKNHKNSFSLRKSRTNQNGLNFIFIFDTHGTSSKFYVKELIVEADTSEPNQVELFYQTSRKYILDVR